MELKSLTSLFPFSLPEKATYQPPLPIWNGEPVKHDQKDELLLTEYLEIADERAPNESAILELLSGVQKGFLKQSADGHLF
ncbi:MAG: hypothetical protein P0S94_04800, partial [Simkaniaceae bacterium]|nr:hypothetical protein [Simkaniaceae bacterium]